MCVCVCVCLVSLVAVFSVECRFEKNSRHFLSTHTTPTLLPLYPPLGQFHQHFWRQRREALAKILMKSWEWDLKVLELLRESYPERVKRKSYIKLCCLLWFCFSWGSFCTDNLFVMAIAFVENEPKYKNHILKYAVEFKHTF